MIRLEKTKNRAMLGTVRLSELNIWMYSTGSGLDNSQHRGGGWASVSTTKAGPQEVSTLIDDLSCMSFQCTVHGNRKSKSNKAEEGSRKAIDRGEFEWAVFHFEDQP